jgi:cullin-associated NEDD8-dissociated protein 1
VCLAAAQLHQQRRIASFSILQVAAEALRVCEQMVSVIRPNPPAPTAAELSPVVSSMFACINSRLAAQDQDQEVKECAILCMAHLVATCGDLLSAEVGAESAWQKICSCG